MTRRLSTLDIWDPDPKEYGRRLDEIQAAESGPVITYRLAELERAGPARRPALPASREVLHQFVQQGLTNAEIGDRLGVSAQAVAKRLGRLGIRRSPEIQSEIRKRKALEREQRRRGASAVEPAPVPRPLSTPASAVEAVLAAISRTAERIPGEDPEAACAHARALETLVRVWRMLATPVGEGGA